MLIIHFLIIILFISSLYFLLENILLGMIFKPDKIDNKELKDFNMHYKNNTISGFIINKKNNMKIMYTLLNYKKKPSFNDDNIIFFCHGNAGWIGNIVSYDGTLKSIFNNYTIFIFDYCTDG